MLKTLPKMPHKYLFSNYCNLILFFIFLYNSSVNANNASFEILKNNSFDDFLLFDTATHWKDNSSWADLEAIYSKGQGQFKGDVAQIIQCKDYMSGALQFIQSGIELKAGHIYRIRVVMRGNLQSPVDILLRKHGRPYTTYAVQSFIVGEKWKSYEYETMLTHDDGSAQFMIRFRGNGTLVIDQASLLDVTNQVTPSISQNVENLLKNPGFELGEERWVVSAREVNGYKNNISIQRANIKVTPSKNTRFGGKYSMEISIPANAKIQLSSPYIKLLPRKKYSLSFNVYSKSSRSIKLGLKGGTFRNPIKLEKDYRIKPGWTKVTMTKITPNIRNQYYYAYLQIFGQGTVRIDNAQLINGTFSTYTRPTHAEVGIEYPEESLFVNQGVVSFVVKISDEDNVANNYELIVSAKDYYGNVSTLFSIKNVTSPQNVIEVPIEFLPKKTGYYLLAAELYQGGVLVDRSEKSIVMVPDTFNADSLNSAFGGHVSFSEQSLKDAKMFGVKWIRLHPPLNTKWFLVEPQKGKFVFDDEAILSAKRKGFNILGTLGTSPRWASSAPANLTSENAHGYRAYLPKSLDDWENYVYQTVKHYKGIIDYWEVWNEPDSGFLKLISSYKSKAKGYASLLKRAYRAAKKANPNAVVVAGPSTHQPPSHWYKKILEAGAYQYFDIASFHFYPGGISDELNKELLIKYADGIRNVLLEYGQIKPIWETESGLSKISSGYSYMALTNESSIYSAQDAAKHIIKKYIALQEAGVDKWFYYHMFTLGLPDRQRYAAFLEWDGAPTPAVAAYAVLSSLISDMKFSKTIKSNSNIQISRFSGTDGYIDVAWAKNKQEVICLAAPTEYMKVKIIDFMGNMVVRNDCNKNGVKLNLDNEPVYVKWYN